MGKWLKGIQGVVKLQDIFFPLILSPFLCKVSLYNSISFCFFILQVNKLQVLYKHHQRKVLEIKGIQTYEHIYNTKRMIKYWTKSWK